MKSPCLKYLVVFFLALQCFIGNAGNILAYDTSSVNKVKIDKKVEESIFSDKAYQYEKVQGSASNFLSDFFEWIIRKLFGDFSSESVSAFWNILLYILGALFIAGIIYIIWKNNGKRLFKGESAKTSIFNDVDEDIEKLDIDKLIRDALQAEDYKLAYRYTFLKSLQLMHSKELIAWMPYKTNFEYYNEFKVEKIKPLFKDLFMGFEYVWYGDAEINKEVFEKYSQEFKSFNSQIGA